MSKYLSPTRILILILVVLGCSSTNKDCFCTNRIDGYSLSAIQLNFLDYGKSESLETLIDKIVSKYNAVVKVTKPIYGKMPYLKLAGTGLSQRVVKDPHVSKQGATGKTPISKKKLPKKTSKKQNVVFDYKRTYKMGKQTFYVYYYPLDKNRITWTALFTTKERITDTIFKDTPQLKPGQEFDLKKIGSIKLNPEMIKAKLSTQSFKKLDLAKLHTINHRYTFSHYMDGQFESDVCINMQIFLDKILRKFFNFGKELHPFYGTPMHGISSLLTNRRDKCNELKYDFRIDVPKDITRINKKTFNALIETSINLQKVYKNSGHKSIYDKALENIIKGQTGLEVLFEKPTVRDSGIANEPRRRSVAMIDNSSKKNSRQSMFTPQTNTLIIPRSSVVKVGTKQPTVIPKKSAIFAKRNSVIHTNDVQILDAEPKVDTIGSKLVRSPSVINLRKPSKSKRNSHSTLRRNSNAVSIDDPFKTEPNPSNSNIKKNESVITGKLLDTDPKGLRQFVTINADEIIRKSKIDLPKSNVPKLNIRANKPIEDVAGPLNTPTNINMPFNLPTRNSHQTKYKSVFFNDVNPYKDNDFNLKPSQAQGGKVDPTSNYFTHRRKTMIVGKPEIRPENKPSFEDYGLEDFKSNIETPIFKSKVEPKLIKGDMNINDILKKMTPVSNKKDKKMFNDPVEFNPSLNDYVSGPVEIQPRVDRLSTPGKSVIVSKPKEETPVIKNTGGIIDNSSVVFAPIGNDSRNNSNVFEKKGSIISKTHSIISNKNDRSDASVKMTDEKLKPKILISLSNKGATPKLIIKNKSTRSIIDAIFKGEISLPKDFVDNIKNIAERQKNDAQPSVSISKPVSSSVDANDLGLPKIIAPIIEESRSQSVTLLDDRISVTVDDDTPSQEAIQKGLSPIPSDRTVIEKNGIVEFNPNDSDSAEPVVVHLTSAPLSICPARLTVNEPEIKNIDANFTFEMADNNPLNQSINNIVFGDPNISGIDYDNSNQSFILSSSLNLKDLLKSKTNSSQPTSRSSISNSPDNYLPINSSSKLPTVQDEEESLDNEPTIKVIKPVEYVSAQIQTDSIGNDSIVASTTSIHENLQPKTPSDYSVIEEEIFKPVNISLPESFNDITFQTIAPEDLANIQNEILMSELKLYNSKPDVKDIDDDYLAEQYSYEQSIDEEDDYKKLPLPQYNQPGTSIVPEILGQSLIEEAKNVNLVMRSDAAIKADLEAIKRDKLFEKPTKRNFIFDSRTSRELRFDKIVYPGVKTVFEDEADDEAMPENLEFQRKIKFINWLIKKQKELQIHSPAKYNADWFRIDEDLTIECSRPQFQIALLLYVLLFHQYELITAQVTQEINDYMVEVTNHFVYQIDGRVINVNIRNKEELSGFSEEDYEPIISQMTSRLVPKIELIDTKVEIIDRKKHQLI
jgi:hypothetical protein